MVFFDETGFLLQPLVRRTWARCGQTPIQYSWDRHDRLSVIGALTLAPRRQRLGLYVRLHDHNVRAPDVVSFVRHLRRHQRRRLILVCDRLNVHRSAARHLKEQYGDAIEVEWLPPYAPDLNPVEAMWSQTKYCDLANFLPHDCQHLEDVVLESLSNQYYDQRLKQGFFHAAQLHL